MRVVVGRIGRPHGIRGEVTVEPRTDEPDLRFEAGSELLTADGSASLVVEYSHWHSGRLLLALEGVEDRNAAEALRGTILEVERPDDAVPEGDDEYYDTALIGCRVRTVAGVDMGVVTEVAHLPSQDLLVIAREDESEVLIPFVTEIVPHVSLVDRIITIDPPPGLIGDDD